MTYPKLFFPPQGLEALVWGQEWKPCDLGSNLIYRVKLLASLTGDKNRVLIPAFCEDAPYRSRVLDSEFDWADDAVRVMTEEEKGLYELLGEITHKSADSLAARWREPSLTLHTIEISGPQSASSCLGCGCRRED